MFAFYQKFYFEIADAENEVWAFEGRIKFEGNNPVDYYIDDFSTVLSEAKNFENIENLADLTKAFYYKAKALNPNVVSLAIFRADTEEEGIEFFESSSDFFDMPDIVH